MFLSPPKVETNSTNITDPYHCNDQVGERVVISICTYHPIQNVYKICAPYISFWRFFNQLESKCRTQKRGSALKSEDIFFSKWKIRFLSCDSDCKTYPYTFCGDMKRYIICQMAYSKSICLNFRIRLRYFCRLAVADNRVSCFPWAGSPLLNEEDVGEDGGDILAQLLIIIK